MHSIGKIWLLAATLLAMASNPAGAADKIFNVRDYGAAGDGKTTDTQALRTAMKACADAGGGTVLFPAGVYLTATLHLSSNMTLNIEPEARILGVANNVNAYDQPEPNEQWDKYQDYGHSHFHNSLMWGEKIENFTITGGGTIHGGGISWRDPPKGGADKILSLTESKNIKVKNIKMLNGGHFLMLLNDCEGIEISELFSRTPRDGIDLMGCRNVLIENCEIRAFEHPDYDVDLKEGDRLYAGDDCVGIKSDYALGKKSLSENIIVRHCKFSSGCNGVQFGSETTGDFRNIQIHDIEIIHAGKAGLGITSNDGGTIENVSYKNITIAKAGTPLYINITDRLRTPEKVTPGKIKNITFENITATDSKSYSRRGQYTSSISGLPGYPVEDITFKNVKITYKGGGTKEQADLVPHYPIDYSPGAMGERPASAWYIRNAKNIVFDGFEVAFEAPEMRPAFVLQNVDGIVLKDVKVQRSEGGDVDVVLRKAENVDTSKSPDLKVEKRDAPDPVKQVRSEKRKGKKGSDGKRGGESASNPPAAAPSSASSGQ